jgi:hypothetical protein
MPRSSVRSCLERALGALALVAAGCAVHADLPASRPLGPLAGRAPRGFDPVLACGAWTAAIGEGGGIGPSGVDTALSHASFPELDPRACFVPVHDHGGVPRPDPTPAGCGYPEPGSFAQIEREAARYEHIAEEKTAPLPLDLACALPRDVRRAAAHQNARALRALARRLRGGGCFPYAAVSTFGFGAGKHGKSALFGQLPGGACRTLAAMDLDLLGVNVTRARRAALAYHARVAPVVTVSGGAVHSRLLEAFALHALVTCQFGVPSDAVLLDPCADHTHTNIRNTGSLVVRLGGRTAYIVTDDGLQAAYLQEWTLFDLLNGSVDQRALRDFGHLVGSFRQASRGMNAGFWYTPYQFWAEPRPGLGDFTCLR